MYIGYQQLNVNFNIGVDFDNSSYASNSILDFELIGLGPLSNYAPGGVWMIRVKWMAKTHWVTKRPVLSKPLMSS